MSRSTISEKQEVKYQCINSVIGYPKLLLMIITKLCYQYFSTSFYGKSYQRSRGIRKMRNLLNEKHVRKTAYR